MMILKQFDNKEKLEINLSNKIIQRLKEGIDQKGFANILLSGGGTPLKLYERLGETEIDWSNVNVGLVDERFVPSDNEFNNHRKIEEALNKSASVKIEVLPMVVDSEDFENNLFQIKELYKSMFEEIDFCLLGMGEDGHTASIFPNDPQSHILINDSAKNIGPALAPSFPENRISCNKTLILAAKHTALMIIGMKKLKKLQDSIDQRLPISEFSESENELKVYFTTT